MTLNINRQEVTEYLADYEVPEFLIDLICEDEAGDELVRGWHMTTIRELKGHIDFKAINSKGFKCST